MTEEMPAPTCTDGPSRPRAIPLASEPQQRKNLATTVRIEMNPSSITSADLVCGMPLPRAPGKWRKRNQPVMRAPSVGAAMRRQPAEPAG
jgi:hypothetical protein